MTTKEQERQAIEKIREIVRGMGERSYLATAMEGVLETAEENIVYDAAFSLKSRAEVAEKRESELQKENENLRKTLKETVEKLVAVQSKCDEAYSKLRKYAMPYELQCELKKMVLNALAGVKLEAKTAADEMADAIVAGGQNSARTLERAEWYKKKREEQITLDQIHHYLSQFESQKEA